MPRKGFMVRDPSLIAELDALVERLRDRCPQAEWTRERLARELLRGAARDTGTVRRLLRHAAA